MIQCQGEDLILLDTLHVRGCVKCDDRKEHQAIPLPPATAANARAPLPTLIDDKHPPTSHPPLILRRPVSTPSFPPPFPSSSAPLS